MALRAQTSSHEYVVGCRHVEARHMRVCCAGMQFVAKSVERAKAKTVGDPFTDVEQGPQVVICRTLFWRDL